MSDNNNRLSDKQGHEEWPWYGQLLLFAIMLLVIVAIFVLVPFLSVKFAGQASGQFNPQLTSYVALTAVLLSGIFLFMTFRIDRGARYEARRAAEEGVSKVTEETVADKVKKILLVDPRAKTVIATALLEDDRGKTMAGEKIAEATKSLLLNDDAAQQKLKEGISPAVERFLPEQVEEQLPGAVKLILLASEGKRIIDENVDKMVEEKLPSSVHEILPEYLNNALPDPLSQEVMRQLPNEVKKRINDAVLLGIITEAAGQIRSGVENKVLDALPGEVKKQLPAVAEDIISEAAKSRKGWRFWE